MSMRHIYRKIARKHGVSAKVVKTEMQQAIKMAYQNPEKEDYVKEQQKEIKSKKEIPTSEEVIQYIVQKMNIE